MKGIFRSACFCLFAGLFSACDAGQSRVVVIQPFSDFPSALAKEVHRQISVVNAHTILLNPIGLPGTAYYPARGRYRADSLIAFLKQRVSNEDTVVIGLTTKDISTSKDGKADWGIMGLAYRPGRSCIVSTFRLKKERLTTQFYKVSIHELGHTQGLPHCPDPTCFMRDAEGGNPTDDEYHFCINCMNYLKRHGWKLH
jgi:archaemetzincin